MQCERYELLERLGLRIGDSVEYTDSRGFVVTGVVVLGRKYAGPRVKLDNECPMRAYVELTEKFRKSTR